ncbi:MAG: hypothetical protein KDK70_41860, partial [Myxococcales bacterium]|nr:hypothetical protein [Myxococcales bacterium]
DFAGGVLLTAQSAAIMTVPRSLARVAARLLPVALAEPPLPLPALRAYLSWHQRFDEDPGHRWFRERVIECTADLDDASVERPSDP